MDSCTSSTPKKMYLDNIIPMSTYKFTPDQFICTDASTMKTDIDRYKSSFPNTYFDKFPEIKQNCRYKEQYNTLEAHEKQHEDTKAHYERTWRQTANISLGICCILAGIYTQF